MITALAIDNYYSFAAFLLGLLVFLGYFGFMLPRQLKQVFRPKDGFTRARWIVLALLIMTLATSILPLVYQYLRFTGHAYVLLQNLSGISTQINKISTFILLFMLSIYRPGR